MLTIIRKYIFALWHEVRFILYTTDKKKIIDRYINNNSRLKRQYIEVIEFKGHASSEARKTAIYQVLDILNRCLEEKAVFFHAPPDCIFGNGSLYNSLVTSFEKKKCFASALPRVSLDVLDEITPYPKQGIKNSELVRLCMKFPHDSFKYANEEKDENTTHLGVSYRRILPKLYSITHSLPSAYLIFPVKEDYEYFKKVQDFNMWDRGWLDLLVRTNRLKVSGSSDLFFLMELTNIPFNKKGNLIPGQMGNDQVTKPEFQHKVLSMFTSVWRSD